MNFTYEQRLRLMREARFDTGAVPEHGVMNPISDLLVEYYRRVARFDEPRVARIPPTPETLRCWFARHLTSEDGARIEDEVTGLCEDLRKCVYVDFITMEALFRAILLWSLLVDRKQLALEDDPSVPLLSVFAAGYSLKWVSHGLEIWGEVPWTIDPSELMRRAEVRR